MKQRRVAFSTTPSGLAWLKQTAQEAGMPLSAVVRDAVLAHPDAPPKQATSPRTERVQMRVDDDIARSLGSTGEVKVSDKIAGVLAAYRERNEA